MTMTMTIVVCDVDGVLTDGSVYVDSNGGEGLRFCKRDGWLLERAKADGIEVVMVTDDPNGEPARQRALKLMVSIIATFGHGRDVFLKTESAPALSSLTEWTKAGVVRALKSHGHRVVYIGDSPADLEAMREADEAWCPRDGEPVPDGTVISDGVEDHTDAYDVEGGRTVNIARTEGGHGVLHEVLGYLLARAK